MEKPTILHLLTPAKNASPFDVNMAFDAGWDKVPSYSNVELDDVSGLIQDAIFSRGPSGVKRTGAFIGGRDMVLAMDMLDNAKGAMVPPFEISVFADPSGAFTTAAGLMACVEKQLQDKFQSGLKGAKVVILGGTGPVGATAAVLAAKAGATSYILGRQKDKADRVAAICAHNYGADITGVRGESNEQKGDLIIDADVILGTAAAGVRVLTRDDIQTAKQLKVVADVNAVPPTGIEGVDVMANGEPLEGSVSGAVCIGALAIGNVKYKTQAHLLQHMINAGKPVYLHFDHAFEFAREYVNR